MKGQSRSHMLIYPTKRSVLSWIFTERKIFVWSPPGRRQGGPGNDLSSPQMTWDSTLSTRHLSGAHQRMDISWVDTLTLQWTLTMYRTLRWTLTLSMNSIAATQKHDQVIDASSMPVQADESVHAFLIIIIINIITNCHGGNITITK